MSERADVIVVGGGAIGVACAWFLAARGIGVLLLERGEICSGCSYGRFGRTRAYQPVSMRSRFQGLSGPAYQGVPTRVEEFTH